MPPLRRLRLEAVDGGAIQRPDLISEKMKQENLTTKEVAIHLGELFGEEFQPSQIKRFQIEGDFLFFKMNEKHFYEWGNNKMMVYSVYVNSIYGEIYDEFEAKGFQWGRVAKLVEGWGVEV